MQSNIGNPVLNDRWFRHGRGHVFSFYATRLEISQHFLDFFSDEPENVYICGTDLVQLENSMYYKQVSFYYAIRQIMECLVRHQKTLNFHIGLERLTPSCPLIRSNDYAMMSLSGLINLQIHHTVTNKTKQMPPCSLGIVNKIANFNTHEIIEHTDYHQLYQQLKRRIKKQLKYKTVFRATQTIDTGCYMSEGIVEQWKSGEIFDHDPICPRALVHQCACPRDL